MKSEKLLFLESLRGIAALSVAFYHFKIGSHFNNSFTDNAWLMVDFFFVLSGFVIALNYIGRISSVANLVAFQKKRFLRLYPLHFIMLMAFIGLEILKLILQEFAGVTINYPPFSDPNNWLAIIANLFLIQNWVLADLTFNYPSWSISAEFITYALFGSLLLITQSSKRATVTSLIILTLIFGVLLSSFGMGADNISGPLRCLYSFSIGALVFFVFSKIRGGLVLSSSLLSAVFLSITVWIIMIQGEKDSDFVVLLPFLFGALILVMSVTDKNTLLIRSLSTKWLVFLGTISYGIYMIHVFVFSFIAIAFNRFLGVEFTTHADGEVSLVLDNVFLADLVHVIGIGIIVACAYVSYRWIELRFTKPKSK